MFLRVLIYTLLLAFLTSCAQTGLTPGGGQPLPGTPVPPDLQGDWRYGTVSSIDYYDPNTGSWGQPSGTGIYFTLGPKGDYERSSLLQITTYGCESYVFIWEVGTVAVNASQITFQPSQSAVKSQSCTPDNTSEEFNTVEPETFTWAVAPDAYGDTILTLTYPSGEETLYDRPN
jgi:hypothetical protein